MGWISVILIAAAIATTTNSILSFSNHFKVDEKTVDNSKLLVPWAESQLERKLVQILCNLNVKSIYIRFDDELKTNIVDRIIYRMWQCPKITPIRVLL